ncbi:MAG: glycosyl hydrolase family 18 protein [Clostridium chrysemydis]|uniref:glycosyl hydrolase family 18 protein n=1 Tax=Clostridium chrysemydis TaxID=2665504 RepID=UPI003F37EBE1
MAKRALKKHVKVFIACATLTSVLIGSTTTLALPISNTKDGKSVEQKQTQKRNVMYYGDWSIWGGEEQFYPKDIPADQLTHLNFAFMDFDANGNLIFTDKGAAVEAPVGMDGVTWGDANAGLLAAFQELKAKNPNLKIGISLGGWSKSGDFSEVAASPEKTKNLVNNVLNFIRYTNMDFVDLDWEYPCSVRAADKVDNQNDEGTPNSKPEDKENYIKLLQAFRTALDTQEKSLGKEYELSVALPAPIARVDEGIDVDALFNVVDFANIMTYDMRGAWDPITGHQTGLYSNPNDPYKGKGLSVDESVNYLIKKGAEPEKIVVGAAYYTRGWEKSTGEDVDKTNPGLFKEVQKVNQDADRTPTAGANNYAPVKDGDGGRRGGVWPYRKLAELKKAYPGLKEYWDDTAKAPYLYDSSTGAFFTYDNVKSIGEKTNYVNQKNLGGMIAWMASQDAPINNSTVRGELTTATKKGLYGDAALPKHEIVYEDLDITCTVTTFKESWSDKGGYNLTIKNNEKADEKGEVLQSVEKTAETIKNAKIYIKTDGLKITGGDYNTSGITYEGDYAVIDLGKVYSGKLINQGASYTMQLSTNVAPKDLSNVKEISMSQRITQNGPELSKQLLFGSNINVNSKPTFQGINNSTIYLNDSFDPLKGVTASDKEDGDLTSKIKVTGSVDNSKLGDYTITYSVTDSKNETTTQTRVISVKEAPKPEDNKPTLSGITDLTIKLNESFDPNRGVSAKDIEDGDLTSKIKVTGTVDNTKEGKYTLTYSVTDSHGNITTASRVITVIKDIINNAYDKTKVYNTGDIVSYNGKTYKAKWWTQGEIPGSSAVWEEVVTPSEDGSVNYVPGKAYNGGDIVNYNGAKYKAAWWTNSVPGSDSSWIKL